MALGDGISANDVLCVSVGTGENRAKSISASAARSMGFAEWAFPLVGIFMGGASAHVHNLVERLLPDENYCRFEFLTDQDLSMDDASDKNVGLLAKLADEYLSNSGSTELRGEEEEKDYDFSANLERLTKALGL